MDLDVFLRLFGDFDERDLVWLEIHRDKHHIVFSHLEFVVEMLLFENIYHRVYEIYLTL